MEGTGEAARQALASTDSPAVRLVRDRAGDLKGRLFGSFLGTQRERADIRRALGAEGLLAVLRKRLCCRMLSSSGHTEISSRAETSTGGG